MEKRYLCIDVGGTAIKYALLDQNLQFYERGNLPTPKEGVEQYLDVLEGIYRTYEAQVEGIAMSVPGMIDSSRGICVTGGNLQYVEMFPLTEMLERRCHVPVTVMNDAKCAALAEATWGVLSDCQDAVVIVLGTGIGGALIKDGEVHMGKNFGAGEFSSIMFDQKCEDDASVWSGRNGNERLIRLAAEAKGVSPAGVTGYDVFAWAEEGHEGVLQVLDQFAKDIAFAITNLQVIFDPERFAIGGGISRQPLLLELIRKHTRQFRKMIPKEFPPADVRTCKYYNDSNLIGALGYYLSRVTPG